MSMMRAAALVEGGAVDTTVIRTATAVYVDLVAVLPRWSALYRERGSLLPLSVVVEGAALFHVAFLEAPSQMGTAVSMLLKGGMHQFGGPTRVGSFTTTTTTPPKVVVVAAVGWAAHILLAAWEERAAPPALPALQQLP